MPTEPPTSLRAALDFLKAQGELVTVDNEIDPIYEISGLQKACENGPAFLFEKIKGYHGVRDAGNIFSRRQRVAALFGETDPRKLKLRCMEAIKKPLPSRVVKEAPCQEVCITEGIDITATLPVLKHTEKDGARVIGGGIALLSGGYFSGGTHLSFNRMHFRGRDWASIALGPGSHMGDAAFISHRGQKLPVTINIGISPAATMVAAAEFLHTIVPEGSDELGFAGALQGKPVDIVPARTVDAYAIADAEWVIEGYIDLKRKTWETEEAEKLGRGGVAPLFPEWTGYMGRAYQQPVFQATALTHRKDKPIYHSILACSLETHIAGAGFREACYFELANRLRPHLVADVNILEDIAGWGSNIIFQVHKKGRADEGHHRNILLGALAASRGLRLAIAVDEDVNIYSPQDVLWAVASRANPATAIIRGAGGRIGEMLMPAERASASQEREEVRYEGGLAIDATVPVQTKWNFERARHPVDKVELSRWLTPEEIKNIQGMQGEYARWLAQTGR